MDGGDFHDLSLSGGELLGHKAFVFGPAQADAAPACVTAPGAFASACTGSSAYYATLTLQVGGKTVSLSTDGFQGWVSNASFNIGGPFGVNSNYVVGV